MNEDPSSDELTIEEAAEVLNVSLAFVSGLIEAGALRARGHDATRRLFTADVLAYRALADAAAEEALRMMTEGAEAAGLYDE